MIIIHGTSQKTNGLQFSSGPRKQCPRFRFSHREKPKTQTTRTLSNSSKKNVNKYVSIVIIHRMSRKTNGVQFSSGPRNQCPRFRFWHREKPKTRTSRTLPNSSKKNVNKYVSIIIIHRKSRNTNNVQFSSGPRNQCPRFRFWYKEKPKTRTSQTLSNSPKKVLS